jgi:hypothetical protein
VPLGSTCAAGGPRRGAATLAVMPTTRPRPEGGRGGDGRGGGDGWCGDRAGGRAGLGRWYRIPPRSPLLSSSPSSGGAGGASACGGGALGWVGFGRRGTGAGWH